LPYTVTGSSKKHRFLDLWDFSEPKLHANRLETGPISIKIYHGLPKFSRRGMERGRINA
jgi:hypothetical protein